MKSLFNLLLILFVLVIVVLVSIAYTLKENPGLELLDIDLVSQGEVMEEVIATIKVSQREFNLQDCILSVGIDGVSADLEYSEAYSEEFLNTYRPIVVPDDFTVYDVNQPITIDATSIGSVDGDSIDDFIFVCHPSNGCPSSYSGRYIAFNLSTEDKLIFIYLDGETDVDLTQSSQELDIDYQYDKDYIIGLSVHGESLVPYSVGLNHEEVSVFGPPYLLPQDIDNDGKPDFIALHDDLVFFVSGTDVPIIYPKTTNHTDFGFLYMVDGSIVLSPDKLYSGKFSIDIIVGDDSYPLLSKGDIVRIHANTPRISSIESSIEYRLTCGGQTFVSFEGRLLD